MRAAGLVWVAAVAGACRAAPEFDLVLTGGRIVDGTGNPWFYGDIAVRGGRIAGIAPVGTLASRPAKRRLVLKEAVVAPGFIDILSQSQVAALDASRRMVSKVTQGVTTEILGEGITFAPANEHVNPGAPRAFRGDRGFGNWLEAMEQRGLPGNIGSFVGAATVRRYAMAGAAGPPSPAQLDTMRAAVRRAMEDGAFGVASALEYAPGSYASTEELIELVRVIRPYGGVYASHLRSEGDSVLQGLDEALRIGQTAGVPVEIHHLKVAGRSNWPKLSLVVAKIDSARAAGQDIGANMYPYTAGQTRLSACLPAWASADGKLLERLSDSSTRARLRSEMLHGESENLCRLSTPDGVVVEGARLSDIAGRLGMSWADVVIEWTLRRPVRVRAIFSLTAEDALPVLARQPWMKFATDAAALDPERASPGAHPRAYGTYPRVLGRFVREERVLSLEEAVRKMTSAVATRLSLTDRGLLRTGMSADIVVFDPAAVADRATYAEPHQAARGIRHVFVNGVEVARDGVYTGAKPGRAIRRQPLSVSSAPAGTPAPPTQR